MIRNSSLRLIQVGIIAGWLLLAGCSRLLPPRHGATTSAEFVLDTRRYPLEQLSGCFIPAVFPAVTKIPIIFLGKVPEGAVWKSAKVVVGAQNGEMSLLEPVIEDNQVYLKFAVPAVDSFTQYNVRVEAQYEYR
jgi:hypothetical protein